ncbi:SnoaL-like polyketide cyclase [Devosia sp. YR412]|uniref:ester cyclase n=1 Tax=Devosia sp. YR412 TaxID=1881030 RepID=UPI0008ADEF24|nr:ester cyclase [Devosia sp. YR412]SEQ11210.1 SnoaL-like polyketide cyclase [Devosia sp. YR412]
MSVDDNKAVVRRFNSEVIEQGSVDAFDALMAPGFINHAAPQGAPNGPESMWNTFQNILRPALSNLTVIIHEQIAEGERVTTRKTITGVHSGTLLGIPATGRPVAIDIIDIVRILDGRYAEHWGLNTMSQVLTELRKP